MDTAPSLRPREHGATAQLLVCLGASLLAGPWQLAAQGPALLLALAFLSAFLGAEALMVLAGLRGSALRTSLGPLARRRLVHLGLPGSAALVAALGLQPQAAPALLLPALPAAALAFRFARKGVYGPLSENLAALTLATLAYPLRRAAGLDAASALAFTLALGLVLLQATSSVRLLMGSRGHAHPWQGRLALFLLPLASLGLMAWGHPPAVPAMVPGLLGALVLLIAPPERLRPLGWLLAAQTAAAALLLAWSEASRLGGS